MSSPPPGLVPPDDRDGWYWSAYDHAFARPCTPEAEENVYPMEDMGALMIEWGRVRDYHLQSKSRAAALESFKQNRPLEGWLGFQAAVMFAVTTFTAESRRCRDRALLQLLAFLDILEISKWKFEMFTSIADMNHPSTRGRRTWYHDICFRTRSNVPLARPRLPRQSGYHCGR